MTEYYYIDDGAEGIVTISENTSDEKYIRLKIRVLKSLAEGKFGSLREGETYDIMKARNFYQGIWRIYDRETGNELDL